MRMATRLGQTCRRARRAAGVRQIDIASAAGVSHTTISHFEQGRWWHRQTDEIVNAYAELCATTPEALWRAALDLPGA